MAGLTTGRLPRFVKRYASLRDTLLDATRRFADDVSGGRYPGAEHSYT
jgi:3-methyl-2-oxobutanoate hydroxymethyltransferase